MSEKTSGKPKLNLQTVMQRLSIKCDMDKLLVTASQKGEFDCVEFLVKNGANVHAWDDSALCWASRNGHLNIVRFLIEKGADVHAQDDEALRWASLYGHLEVVRFLKDNSKKKRRI